jgi:hypothetical protein
MTVPVVTCRGSGFKRIIPAIGRIDIQYRMTARSFFEEAALADPDLDDLDIGAHGHHAGRPAGR